MADGQIVEAGSHEQLISQEGPYCQVAQLHAARQHVPRDMARWHYLAGHTKAAAQRETAA